jgi:ATP-binding cassette subfamily F protein 3
LIFISHDVHFIRQVARRVLHVQAGRLTLYAGDYDYYLDKSGFRPAPGAAKLRGTDARGSPADTSRGGGVERAALTAGLSDGRPPVSAAPRSSSPAKTAAGPKTKAQKRAEAEARAARSAPLRAARTRLKELEKEISNLESRQAELTAALEAPETYQEAGKAQALNRELSSTVDQLQAANTAWEAAGNEVAALETSEA